jgi:hypothetical protein
LGLKWKDKKHHFGFACKLQWIFVSPPLNNSMPSLLHHYQFFRAKMSSIGHNNELCTYARYRQSNNFFLSAAYSQENMVFQGNFQTLTEMRILRAMISHKRSDYAIKQTIWRIKH